MGYRSVQGGKYWSFLSTKSWRLNMISRLLESITDSMDMYLRWANSRRQWRREASGVLQSMGLRRVRQWLHNCACVLTCFSCVQLFATLWLIALHAPLSMGFSRQEYWGALPCPPPGDLPNPGIEPRSLTLQADSLPAKPQGKSKNTGMGSLSLLQQIFPTQESNRGLWHWRWILYQLIYQGILH